MLTSASTLVGLAWSLIGKNVQSLFKRQICTINTCPITVCKPFLLCGAFKTPQKKKVNGATLPISYGSQSLVAFPFKGQHCENNLLLVNSEKLQKKVGQCGIRC